jgi:hypothetical protein
MKHLDQLTGVKHLLIVPLTKVPLGAISALWRFPAAATTGRDWPGAPYS